MVVETVNFTGYRRMRRTLGCWQMCSKLHLKTRSMLHPTIRMPNVPPYTQHSQHFWSSPWNPPAYHWCRNHKVWHNLLGPVKCWKVSHLGKLENNTVTIPIEARTACASVATVNILSRTSTFRVKALLRVLVAWIRGESTSGVQGSVHPPP